ncbi:MAG: NAD-dependent epimerase/dehydratase family protein [Desulfocucumaceae bacterium]
MQRFLVTGCNGFVGSHVCERLVKEGFSVAGLDVAPYRWKDGFLQSGAGNFHYYEGDLTDGGFVAAAVEAAKPHTVIHLASVVGVNLYIEDPMKVIDVNMLGLRNLLVALRGSGARIVFSSTSEVYGKNPLVPWNEEADRVLGATSVHRWAYSSSKAAAEHMLWACAGVYGIEGVVIRYFNLYGPRQRPDLLVPAQITRALAGKELLVYDGGAQTRCFTYIEDAVSGTMAAALSPHSPGRAFNIGANRETTVREITSLIGSLAGGSFRIKEVSAGDLYGKAYEDIPRRVPDTQKAARILGWKAETPLREGLLKTIEWWRAQTASEATRL